MPKLPIPPVLSGFEAGSFAEDTIRRRLPEIAGRVIRENSFGAVINVQLQELIDNLPDGRIRPFMDEQAPDWTDWRSALQPYLGQTWLEAGMFVAEMYFYRRILEATGYFLPGVTFHLDPYSLQKSLGLSQAAAALEQALPGGLPQGEGALDQLVHLSLWGNQADLSLWPVGDEGGGRSGGKARLVIDQTAEALGQLEGLGGGRVDLLLDNSGSELGFDLLLADALIGRGARVILQVKPHPCFVSDVIREDVMTALRWLGRNAPAWARPVAGRLQQALGEDKLQIADRFYWASPYPAWEMPGELQKDLEGSRLIVSKGDVHYRRWIGDARWQPDTPLAEIIDPPAPLLLLRVPKSDVAAGLPPGRAQELSRQDPGWMVDGHWGLIQSVK